MQIYLIGIFCQSKFSLKGQFCFIPGNKEATPEAECRLCYADIVALNFLFRS